MIQKLQLVTANYGATDAHKRVEYGMTHLLMNIRDNADFADEARLGFINLKKFIERKLDAGEITAKHATALKERVDINASSAGKLFAALNKGTYVRLAFVT